ncbi:hypothetical protein B0T26DRAFT_752258 [Lasiosphaeria miniovina]|uniref:Alpha-1,3-mannosyltransferase n=1 Tax=Lasiosphaeria miniovina TaxID=1954250 RepID=A0AA40E0M9_9PEZI|nr:uncharacterized protein B0T26DRAFT_752258 [Lasiosphaeria miniovina]KAK0718323.1 hypothetical protein B0T26DRAFT_752258 [Lasiosphaeria miniovina]
MPPPHLHPRSRMTSSLFATTVVASFFVVALPHILPCPAPRIIYADGEMSDGTVKRRRRRRPDCADTKEGLVQFQTSIEDHDEATKSKASKRECPVPKPGGMLGELLGFRKTNNEGPRSGPESR